MNGVLHARQITDDVYWVGAVDWRIRDFHGYLTDRGTTYNAYLVLADKVTLIDTVKNPFFDEMMQRISSVIDPGKIDYIVSNHAEMDHSGSLPEAVAAIQPEKVFASKMGSRVLAQHFRPTPDITPVGDMETISLGNMDLTFVETKMLHWPDSMFSYLPQRKVLFSQDALGMHLATNERFIDEVDEYIWTHEAAKYYANILMPFSPLITKLLTRLGELSLDIELVLTDHGPVWRGEDIGKILDLYGHWARRQPTCKAVIVYETMWESTALMARAIAEGLDQGGVCVKVMPLGSAHRSDVATEILDAGALIVGSPTINNQVFPSMADVMTYLTGLKPANLIGAAFGSYGWSGEAVGHLEEMLGKMNVEIAAEAIKAQWVPDEAVLQQCHDMGQNIAEQLVKTCPARQTCSV